jgi:hypothetical protein
MFSLGDLGSIVSIALAGVILLPLLGVGVFVVVVVANRAEPDPSGRRPLAVYLYAASFVTLLVTMVASFGVVARLCSLIGRTVTGGVVFPSDDDSGDDSSSLTITVDAKHPVGDAVTREAVLFLLIALVAGAALWLHLRAASRLPHDPGTPVARVRASYGAAVAFVSVLIIVVFAIVALYDVCELVSPAIFAPDSGGNRSRVFRSLIPALYFADLAVAVLWAHLRMAPPDQRPTVRRPRPVAPPDGPYDISADAGQPTVVTTGPPMATASPVGDDVVGSAPRRPGPRPRPRPRPKS